MTGVPESSQLAPMGKESGTNAKQVPVGVLARGNSLSQSVRRVPKSYEMKCAGVEHGMNSNALTARVLKQ